MLPFFFFRISRTYEEVYREGLTEISSLRKDQEMKVRETDCQTNYLQMQRFLPAELLLYSCKVLEVFFVHFCS